MKSKDPEAYLRTIRRQLDTDILFECFAALLIKSGQLDADQIHVIPTDSHKRNFQNDILPVPKEYENEPEHFFTKEDNGPLQVYSSRNSMLDYLPEDFYATPDNTDEFWDETGTARSQKDIDAYRDKVKAEQKSAQRFFRPLEVAYNKLRIERECAEVAHLENLDSLLETLWDDFIVSDPKWQRFVRTVHLVPHIMGDLEKTRALIEYVLDGPIELTVSVDPIAKATSEEIAGLTGSEAILGYNVVFGNAIYDHLICCTLRICSLSTADFYRYFESTSSESKLINTIIDYYFPLTVEVIPDYSIQKEPRSTAQSEVMVLGYSSQLGV